MGESVIFQCDFCGQRSEEEPANWPRTKHGRVELVLPAQRFHVAPRAVEPVLYEGMPMFPGMPMPSFPGPVGAAFPPSAFPMPIPLSGLSGSVAGPDSVTPSEEGLEDRWIGTLCDQCMRRIAGLLDLKLETHEEVLARNEKLSRDAMRRAEPTPLPEGGRGKMVLQYPTPETGPGGLVDQFPTPKPHPEGSGPWRPSAPAEEPKSDRITIARRARRTKK